MQLNEKMEILVFRKGISKSELAEKAGITYRGLANYLNGSRKPKQDVLERIAAALDTTPEFLSDDSKGLILNSKERLVFNSKTDNNTLREAAEYLEKGKELFSRDDISDEDKKSLFSCITEIYFGSTAKKE